MRCGLTPPAAMIGADAISEDIMPIQYRGLWHGMHLPAIDDGNDHQDKNGA